MTAKAANQLPLGKGKIGFRVSNYYPIPASKLWEAITTGEHSKGSLWTKWRAISRRNSRLSCGSTHDRGG
jgi:hypothetical protein